MELQARLLKAVGSVGYGTVAPLPAAVPASVAGGGGERDARVGGKDLEGGSPLHLGTLTVSAATAIALKALLGLTLFEQPWAAASAGVLVTPVWLVLVSTACLYTAQMLVLVRRAAALAALEDAAGVSAALPALDSLPALAEFCLGPLAAVLTEAAVFAATFGLLAVYLVRRRPLAARRVLL